MAKDPVCNMQVDEKTAAWKSEHEGRQYYFCSEQCKRDFDRNPARYAEPKTGGTGR